MESVEEDSQFLLILFNISTSTNLLERADLDLDLDVDLVLD